MGLLQSQSYLPTWCIEVLNTVKNSDLQPKVAPSFQQINSYCE